MDSNIAKVAMQKALFTGTYSDRGKKELDHVTKNVVHGLQEYNMFRIDELMSISIDRVCM